MLMRTPVLCGSQRSATVPSNFAMVVDEIQMAARIGRTRKLPRSWTSAMGEEEEEEEEEVICEWP